jgi:hypothetical protein
MGHAGSGGRIHRTFSCICFNCGTIDFESASPRDEERCTLEAFVGLSFGLPEFSGLPIPWPFKPVLDYANAPITITKWMELKVLRLSILSNEVTNEPHKQRQGPT